MRTALATLAVLACAVSGCSIFGGGTVTRNVHGRLEEGRFVNETAYFAYAEGAIAESKRQFDVAEQAYETAAEEDDQSADTWTRIGAVRCAKGNYSGSEQAFAKAKRIDAAFAPLWAERASCELAQGNVDGARIDARTSLDLDPSRESTTLLIAKIETRAGNAEEASRWTRGLYARAPWRDDLKKSLTKSGEAAEVPSKATPRANVDEALSVGDLQTARRDAVRARITPGQLAARAAALGQLELAREQASLVLGADPADADARIALLFSGEALHDEASISRALRLVPAHDTAPSAVAVVLLARLLARHGFAEASSQTNALTGAENDEDPLLDRMRQIAH